MLFFFKQKTAYEMRISDWSSDVCSSDLDKGVEFRIHAPLQHMTKADIAAEAARLGMDAGMSWSCYDPTPEGLHCGACDSCRLRSKGFADAGVADPTRYA